MLTVAPDRAFAQVRIKGKCNTAVVNSVVVGDIRPCDSDKNDPRKELTKLGIKFGWQSFVDAADQKDYRAIGLLLDAGLPIDRESFGSYVRIRMYPEDYDSKIASLVLAHKNLRTKEFMSNGCGFELYNYYSTYIATRPEIAEFYKSICPILYPSQVPEKAASAVAEAQAAAQKANTFVSTARAEGAKGDDARKEAIEAYRKAMHGTPGYARLPFPNNGCDSRGCDFMLYGRAAYLGQVRGTVREGYGYGQSGGLYWGEWHADKQMGYGVELGLGGRQSGRFVDGKLMSEGVHEDSTGRYEGEFQNSNIDGYGVKSIFQLYYDNEEHGPGTAAGPVTATLSGRFLYLLNSGWEVYVASEGSIRAGYWTNGELVCGVEYNISNTIIGIERKCDNIPAYQDDP